MERPKDTPGTEDIRIKVRFLTRRIKTGLTQDLIHSYKRVERYQEE